MALVHHRIGEAEFPKGRGPGALLVERGAMPIETKDSYDRIYGDLR